MDLLGYSDTVVDICLVNKPRREVQTLLRHLYRHPTKLRVCPCVRGTADVWLWTSLAFLRPTYSNDITHPE